MTKRVFKLVRSAAPLILVGSLSACGSTSSSLCERAAECDYIGEDDVEECTSDIDRALEKEELESDDIALCLDCANENSCGNDILLDCASECSAVSGYIAFSQVR